MSQWSDPLGVAEAGALMKFSVRFTLTRRRDVLVTDTSSISISARAGVD
jgi:hypothetical protein